MPSLLLANRGGAWRRCLNCFCAVLGLALSNALADEPADKFFDATHVWSIHLELVPDEYRALQPAAGFGFPGGPPPAGGPETAPPTANTDGETPRATESNLFGVAFPWVRAEMTVGGESSGTIGLRYAGDAGYLAAAGNLKRPLKFEFERFGGRPFRGLRAINLHAGALDPSKLRESVALAAFRAAAVPAPCTTLAEVTLTVPGEYDRALLGLYTVVEEVDGAFLEDRLGTAEGLRLKPQFLRDIEYLGEDFAAYRNQYRPLAEPTAAEAGRVVAFARLVQQASDEQFRREIGDYLDVEAFLRFMAANALTSNLESFFALGHNYHLHLHPQSHRFAFIPGDLEFSLANFLLMGTAEQLMDLSLTRPYPGECRLAERLLAIDDVSARYRQIVAELSSGALAPEWWLAQVEALEDAADGPLARENEARTARGEPAPGFGPSAVPGAVIPTPPDLRTFVAARAESVAAQLAGQREGYVPQFNFGPPAGGPGGATELPPLEAATIGEVVQAPPEFDVTLYAAPPEVGYPVAVAAAASGELWVAVDEQGSLGRTPGGGKVLRCRDDDGDGRADRIDVFAQMEHPRGLVVQGSTVWVLHPPSLSVYHDDDGDGAVDREELLVTGLTSELIDTRGGDHTTNGIRLGLDGWIYIAVGDYGVPLATSADGETVTLRGGGILRVRPDGTELEVFATGLRNPFDLAFSPQLDLFTRDNTNDGAGWDVRVSQLWQSAAYGYTQLYANFADEIMPPLGQFGGGGGTGALWIDDPHWPATYRGLYTGDWGRSEVYRHPLRPRGATYDLEQEVFLAIPRPTGMDIDGHGRLYVASWRGGEASVNVGPNVGFVARIAPRGLKDEPWSDVRELLLEQLLALLSEPNAVDRLHAQREIIRRGRTAECSAALVALAADPAAAQPARVAAIFALKQLEGAGAHPLLLELLGDADVREFALRALADRKSELVGLDPAPFVSALADPAPRVQAQALIALGRLGDVSVAASIIPQTSRADGSSLPTGEPIHAQPDAGRVVPHLAVRTLIALRASAACLEALDGPYAAGALQALRSMHDEPTVEGLISVLGTVRSTELRLAILSTLIRLYRREAPYDGTWWGIRPDNTGPYYDPVEWELSPRIGAVVTSAVLDADEETAAFLRGELVRHQVRLPGLPDTGDTPLPVVAEEPLVLRPADPNDPNQIGNLAYETAARRALAGQGDALRGKELFAGQACRACHTDADGQSPKGPHLVDIGKRYRPAELVESILRPSAKTAQGYESYAFVMDYGKVYTGFVVRESARTVQVREANGLPVELEKDAIEERQRQEKSAMPEGMVNNLTPEQLADLVAYLQSLD
jgi:putative membrane-bound dehydrogenase-like protein